MICPLCHTPNREDAKFCKGCGQPLKSLEAAQQVQDVQETPQAVATQAPEAPEQAMPPVSSAPEAAGPEQPDPSLEPTLILSPDKMVAYRARRWNAEAQREDRPDEFANGNSNWSDA